MNTWTSRTSDGSRRRRQCLLSSIGVVLLAGVPGGLSAENLARAIPSDVVFFLHWRSEPQSGFADTYLDPLRRGLAASGFLEAYLQSLGEGVAKEKEKAFREEANYWRKILARVPWWRLLSREVAIGGRLDRNGRLELVLLFDVGAERRVEALYAFREILYGLCAVGEEFELEIRDRDGSPTTVLYNLVDPLDQICAAGSGSVLVLATSARLARRSLRLLEGKGSGVGLLDSDRYARQRKALRAAFGKRDSSGPSRDAASLEILVQPKNLFAGWPQLDVLETYHLVARCGGDRIHSDFLLRLKEDSESDLLGAFTGRERVNDFARGVPAGVAGFEVSAGSEPTMLYEFLLSFLEPFLGRELTRTLEGSREFQIKRDLLGYLSGVARYLAFPDTEGVGVAGRVYLFELKPTVAGRPGIEEKLTALMRLAGKWSFGGLRVRETRVEGAEGVFFVVEFGAVFEGRLYIGVSGPELVIATSPETLRRGLRTREGGFPTILEDEEFSALWKTPEGDLDAVVYGKPGYTLGVGRALLGLAGIVGRLLPGEDRQGLFIFKPILVALPRLRGAIDVLDIVEKVHGYTVRDRYGCHGHRTCFLQRVKKL